MPHPSPTDLLDVHLKVSMSTRKRILNQLKQLIAGGAIREDDVEIDTGTWSSTITLRRVPRWTYKLLG